jgi:hypothetical protein
MQLEKNEVSATCMPAHTKAGLPEPCKIYSFRMNSCARGDPARLSHHARLPGVPLF